MELLQAVEGEAVAQPAGDASLRLLVESIRDYAVFLLTPQGIVSSWNPGAERLKGWTASEIIGRHFSVFYPPEVAASGKLEHELEVARDTGKYEEEGWRVRKDGSRFWASVTITSVRNEEGQLVGFAKVTRDLTEQRGALEALKLSEERLRLMVESVKDYAIFMLDPEGLILTWNTGAARVNGYAASEIIGKHFSVFYSKEEAASGKPAAELREALEAGRYEEEGWRIRQDGSRFWANVVITPVFGPSGALRGFAKVTRDLTERRKAEETRIRLEQADEAIRIRDEFLSIASHELRTPLTPLSLYLQRLERSMRDHAKADSTALEKARRQVRRLNQLIEDLLDLSRMQNGRLEMQRQHFNLIDAARTVIEDVQTTTALHQIHLNAAAAAWVEGDAARVEQVFLNLLQNAIKYSPQGGTIDVDVQVTSAGEVCASVADHGIGIPSEDQPSLFNRFFRARNAETRHFGGLGLGLYLSNEIVRRHGGRFEVQSAPEKGSTFSFFLPLAAPEVASARGEVLVVDDDVEILDAVSDTLKADGYSVVTARNGIEALELLKKHRPDVMMVDLMMPVLDGAALIQRIHGEHPAAEVPIIVFSADQRVHARAAELRADGVLRKPIDYDALQETLARLLPRHQQTLPN